MAEKLDIHIAVTDNQTVSKFAVLDDGHVIFHNDASARLTVEFNEPAALCKGNNPQASIVVDAGQKESLKVCSNTTVTSLKYTATVDNALPEDPILIIEKSTVSKGPINIFENQYLTSGVGGLVIGLLVGYLIARRMMTRNRPAT